MKNFLLLLVVALLAFWWFRGGTPSPVHGRPDVSAASAPAKTAPNPQAAPPQPNQEFDRERRKALAEEYARLSAQREAKEAAYKQAMVAYEAKRSAINEQIDALGRSNKNGINTAVMDQLREEYLRIPLPQRP